jgi:hypothetical protein
LQICNLKTLKKKFACTCLLTIYVLLQLKGSCGSTLFSQVPLSEGLFSCFYNSIIMFDLKNALLTAYLQPLYWVNAGASAVFLEEIIIIKMYNSAIKSIYCEDWKWCSHNEVYRRTLVCSRLTQPNQKFKFKKSAPSRGLLYPTGWLALPSEDNIFT